MDFVDTHCHLQFDDYPDPSAVINNARLANVTKLICVGVNLADSQKAIELAGQFNNVWATAGVHPHDASKYLAEPNNQQKLKALLGQPKVVAIGEIGLDYFKAHSSKTEQQAALRSQIEVGLELGMPFIFHVRDAWQDFWKIFDSYSNITGAVHSFSADSGQLAQILKRGLYVGLNGIMTFTKDDSQLAAAEQVPIDKLLLETDAPFLTPAPFRGKICEPKHLSVTAEFLANLRGESLQKLAKYSTQNAQQLFKI